MNEREKRELDKHITGNYGEDQMSADDIHFEEQMRADPTDEQLEEIRKMDLAVASLDDADAGLNPVSNMDDRAEVAEQMLEDYYLRRIQVTLREAIYNRAVTRLGMLNHVTINYRKLLAQEQSTLDEIKYNILELMGVDA